MKVYISGPISSRLDTYKQEFGEAAEKIAAAGHIPLDPAVLPLGLTKADYMRICLAMIDVADFVVFLPEREDSDGCQTEALYASYTGKQYADLAYFLRLFSVPNKNIPSSVAIKGFKMPHSCMDCPMGERSCEYGYIGCRITGLTSDLPEEDEAPNPRPEWCPLTEQ